MTIVIFFSNGISGDTDDERKLGSPRLAKGVSHLIMMTSYNDHVISDDTADDSENTDISGERGGAGATVVPARLVSSVSQLLESDGILMLSLLMKRG